MNGILKKVPIASDWAPSAEQLIDRIKRVLFLDNPCLSDAGQYFNLWFKNFTFFFQKMKENIFFREKFFQRIISVQLNALVGIYTQQTPIRFAEKREIHSWGCGGSYQEPLETIVSTWESWSSSKLCDLSGLSSAPMPGLNAELLRWLDVVSDPDPE